ncbi:hypothetical protein Tco_1009583, partial [Tanacetum coccineum]
MLTSDNERTESKREVARSEKADEETTDDKEIHDDEEVHEDEEVHDDDEKHDDNDEVADEEKANEEMPNSEKVDEEMADAEKDNVEKIEEEKKEKPKLPPSSSSLSLSYDYGNQFLNVSSDISLVGIVKESAETKINSILSKREKKVAELSKVEHSEVIKESVQANVLNEVKNQILKFLPKAVSEFVEPRLEKTIRDVLKKNLINLVQSSSLQEESEYDLKVKLYNKMQKSHSFL